MKLTPRVERLKTMNFVKNAQKNPEILIKAQIKQNRAVRRMEERQKRKSA